MAYLIHTSYNILDFLLQNNVTHCVIYCVISLKVALTTKKDIYLEPFYSMPIGN